MKTIFLGTGASGGTPGTGKSGYRKNRCCSFNPWPHGCLWWYEQTPTNEWYLHFANFDLSLLFFGFTGGS